MGNKAVYSNKGLQVYITGKDFEEWLLDSEFTVPIFIGKSEEVIGRLYLELDRNGIFHLRQVLDLEQAAINKARNDYGKLRSLNPSKLRKSNRSKPR